MAYSELVKNFEKVRSYMREFYVYGFKSRTEYDGKSARSYDDERRRIESWLGDYMRFAQTSEGKNVFLSVDSRLIQKNPFYKAWKSKSFTDRDITLHFAIFDILHTPEIKMTLSELVWEIDRLLSSKITFDESTLRKKLKEYVDAGIIRMEKDGRKVLYGRAEDTDLSGLDDAIDLFSEAAPCGVIGSFLQDRMRRNRHAASDGECPGGILRDSAGSGGILRDGAGSGGILRDGLFSFKHHYMTQALDSDVMALLFDAIRTHRYVTVNNLGRHTRKTKTVRLVPLKILISAQNGRQNLIAFHEQSNRLNSYRLDYLSDVHIEEDVCKKFDTLRKALQKSEEHMWGVNCKWNTKHTEHVEFEIEAGDDEAFIVKRLWREKRCGRVEKVDDTHYRYVADVFDSAEMLPWIRTFICRITKMNFSNRTVENRFKADIQEMYGVYGVCGTDDTREPEEHGTRQESYEPDGAWEGDNHDI